MSQAFDIVEASPLHIRRMARDLRAAASITLQGFGFDPRRALHRAFIRSFHRRTALVDGRPVAMWGVIGALTADAVHVWLVLSNDIGLMPLTIMRRARRELAEIMQHYEEVGTTVLPDDDAALRFAVHLGFHDREGDDEPLRPRELIEAIRADPRYRIPVGDAYVIGLGYHHHGVA